MRTQLVVALDPSSRIRSGSTAELWFDPGRMHVFDAATGDNLTRDPDRIFEEDTAPAPVQEPDPA
jgi:multiple sugar transport system ATP-binding protein